MLLEFAISNYKSFVDEAVLSMVPAPKQKGLSYSIHTEKIGGKNVKGLSCAVIYGPNASGKTTLIGAMDTLKAVVSRGNICDAPPAANKNRASSQLSLIPNSSSSRPGPVRFRIKFVEGGSVYEYLLEADLGSFADDDYDREVLEESLSVNGAPVFCRKPDSIELNIQPIKDRLAAGLEGKVDAVVDLAVNLSPTDLFLTGVFKTFVSPPVASEVLSWFDRKLLTVYHADRVRVLYRPAKMATSTPYIEGAVNEAAQAFGISSNAVGYMIPEGESEPRLFSLFEGDGVRGRVLPAEDYESYGTLRFVDIFPLVARAIVTGATLVVDEFDASIHPMALMSILSVFHNDEINTKGAQLIFDTHNPVFLNGNVLRRDEIKFVERDLRTGNSQHYSLSDFGTSGPGGVRQGKDYMKGYFLDRYGAISDIDFTPIFERIVEGRGDAHNGK
ncbi:ATP-binding protein [Paratractidigestivibacter sp.]|uniref:AAA family ATPase n=1 Tax=Paratractidigestivibacter sp. TaxID=2847316 RepID=UPI002AC96EE6|nr:ATP-binding protein [Paratractidigestivibacter sp.]